MSFNDELDVLDQAQTEAGIEADRLELEGVDRRRFLFTSLVATAATTFGFGATALAQTPPTPPATGGRGGGGGQGQGTPPVPLGNGEPISWTFQPYPQGTGALMEKLIRERGAAAFARSTFIVDKWVGAVPTNADDIAFLPAHRLSALIKEKKLTSTALTRIYLDRLKKYDPVLLCAVTIMEEQGMAEAAKADAEIKAGKYRGPLHGIPYGIKDLFSTKGVRTTWGAGDFENRIIDEDADVVVRLREAGAVLIAKLSTGLFAQGDQWYRGRTNNPWDIRRGSSGSSAGPSSATAGGCVAFGIGTETSGSIVSPARECGLSALRPTFGRVSRHGGMVLAWSQDRVGPICRTVEDCAMVFNVIHGVDPKDPSTVMTPFQFDRSIKLSSLRIGVDAGAPKEFIDVLKELGAVPKEIGARPGGAGGGFGAESAAAFDFYVQAKAKEFGVDLATLPEPARGGGAGRGGAAGPAAGRAADRDRYDRYDRYDGYDGYDRYDGSRGRGGRRRRSREFGTRHEHGGSHAMDERALWARVRLHPAAAPASDSHQPDVGAAERLRHVRAWHRLRRRAARANRASLRRRAVQVRFANNGWRRRWTRRGGGGCSGRSGCGGRDADTDAHDASHATRRLQQAADLLGDRGELVQRRQDSFSRASVPNADGVAQEPPHDVTDQISRSHGEETEARR